MSHDGPLMSPEQDVDLTNCDREPIHILGQVQGFGCLIALSADWLITHASDNCADLLDLAQPVPIGVPLTSILSDEALRTLRVKLQTVGGLGHQARIYDVALTPEGQRFNVSAHQSDRTIVLEFERATPGKAIADLATVQKLAQRVSGRTSVQEMCSEAARNLRALTGFDRVMVYRFNPDDTGTVIAENARTGVEPYLNLRYPASDIPKQARALYLKSTLRLISDVDGAIANIEPQRDPTGQPLDLSLALTRAVSPIHLEYLRNMGVSASMSVSIIVDGRLWGLFACHHYAPFHVDFRLRSMIELYAQLFTYELAQREKADELAEFDRGRALHDRLMARASREVPLSEEFDDIADDIADVIPFDGIAMYTDGIYSPRGAAPTEEEFLPLARFLNTASLSSVYATDHLSNVFPAAQDYSARVSGILVLPISRTPRDYIVLCRKELAQQIDWGGNPEKPVTVGPNGTRLTPRKSFEAWREVVRDQSAPWTKQELRAAEALRVTLIEVILKITDEAMQQRKRDAEKQDLLIAELNHRVRNILNLIRGLVVQSRSVASSLQEFTATLDDRIHALARAHDQLTENKWTAVSLRRLIEVETDAFSGGKASRVTVTGPRIGLQPTAYSTFALLIHELMTNAAKYGALNDSRGRIEVTITQDQDDTVHITWAERGGPPVMAPSRKGFGTTIIERSVPYELGGTADVDYALTGLVARFTVPARHVTLMNEETVPEKEETPAVETTDALPNSAMVVEDNMIIALDTADILTSAGVTEIITAGSVPDALRQLEDAKPDIAILDVNLGSETSIPVAERLTELGVPFALATGYGGDTGALAAYPEVPVLKKPFEARDLEEVARALHVRR